MMSEEEHDELMRTAMMEFGLNFARYVKEVDIDLWRRAVEYAKDTTDVDGVSFNYPDEEDHPTAEEKEEADWWNDWFTKKGPSDE